MPHPTLENVFVLEETRKICIFKTFVLWSQSVTTLTKHNKWFVKF